MMREPALEEALEEFVGAFEVVFDEEWSYGRDHMVHNMDRIIPADGTFLQPTQDPARVNWGSRAAMLQAYQRLRALMKEHGLEPSRPVRDAYYAYSWDRKPEP